jgi:hypothetical protein
MLGCADPVPPPKPRAMSMMVLDLITNLIPGPQRSAGERLVTGPMLFQYPPMTGRMVKGHKEIHHLLTRTTLRIADIIRTKLLPAIRPICHHQSIRRSKSLREE